jgi:hypothetical protein
MNQMNLFPRDVYFRAVFTNLVARGACDDPDDNDQGPGRLDFTVEVEQGPRETVLEWFHQHSNGYCRYGNTDRFVDLGGCKWNVTEGAVIEVGFPEFFDSWLDTKTRQAHAAVGDLARRALAQIETNFALLNASASRGDL